MFPGSSPSFAASNPQQNANNLNLAALYLPLGLTNQTYSQFYQVISSLFVCICAHLENSQFATFVKMQMIVLGFFVNLLNGIIKLDFRVDNFFLCHRRRKA